MELPTYDDYNYYFNSPHQEYYMNQDLQPHKEAAGHKYYSSKHLHYHLPLLHIFLPHN